MPKQVIPTDDPADLFLWLYDRLGDGPFRSQQVAQWVRLGEVRRLSERVMAHVVETGVASHDLVAPILDNGPYGMFSVLAGLDKALEPVHERRNGHPNDVGALNGILVRYVETGFLNSDRADGLLLFRLSFPGRPLGTPRRSTYFGLIRVPSDVTNKVDYERVDFYDDISFSRPKDDDVPFSGGEDVLGARKCRKLPIGCVPMVGAYAEMEMTRHDGYGAPRYRVEPKREALAERVRTVLNRLDASGAVIGVLPESSLSDDLLAEWQRALREIRRPMTDDCNGSWLARVRSAVVIRQRTAACFSCAREVMRSSGMTSSLTSRSRRK